jgi:hypothetical protein
VETLKLRNNKEDCSIPCLLEPISEETLLSKKQERTYGKERKVRQKERILNMCAAQ